MAVLSKEQSLYQDFLFVEIRPRRVVTSSSSSALALFDDEEDVVEPRNPMLPLAPMSLTSHNLLQSGMVVGLNLGIMSQMQTMSAALAAGGMAFPIAASCVPIVAPFNTPPVPIESWITNKRACAFQRSLMYLSVIQGFMALFKFFSGNLIGGFFDCMIAGVGMYACSPEGVTMLSTYMVFAGFNGIMDFMQVLQMYHGVMPLYLLPFQYPALRPQLLFLGCYFTWEFHKELMAVWRGYNCAGPQDSWFVKAMSHDMWGPQPGTNEFQDAQAPVPRGSTNFGGGQLGDGNLGNLSGNQQRGTDNNATTRGNEPSALPNRNQRFSAFGGEGRRLGE